MEAFNHANSDIYENEKLCIEDPFIFDKRDLKVKSQYANIIHEGELLDQNLNPIYLVLQEDKLIQFRKSGKGLSNGFIKFDNTRLAKRELKDSNK